MAARDRSVVVYPSPMPILPSKTPVPTGDDPRSRQIRETLSTYAAPPPPLDLPLKVDGGVLPDVMLYRQFRPGAAGIDKHPNVAGQYLNAAVFFGVLFDGQSPVGAAGPLNTGSAAAGDRPLTAIELKALQTAAHGVVKGCGKACGL